MSSLIAEHHIAEGCLAIWSNYGANGTDDDCERVYVRDYAALCH